MMYELLGILKIHTVSLFQYTCICKLKLLPSTKYLHMHVIRGDDLRKKREAILLSIFMSVPMSFVMTVVNVGFTDIFLKAFLGSAVIGTIVAIPVAFLAMPLANKLVAWIISK